MNIKHILGVTALASLAIVVLLFVGASFMSGGNSPDAINGHQVVEMEVQNEMSLESGEPGQVVDSGKLPALGELAEEKGSTASYNGSGDLSDEAEHSALVDKGWQNYKNEEFGFEFWYPAEYKIQEQEESNSNSVEVFFTKYDHLRNQPIDCGGYVLQEDEVKVRIGLYEGDLNELLVEKDWEKINIGQNQYHTSISRGMCGGSNIYRYSVDESHYIQISVRNSNTLLLEEAEEIISTIKITN